MHEAHRTSRFIECVGHPSVEENQTPRVGGMAAELTSEAGEERDLLAARIIDVLAELR